MTVYKTVLEFYIDNVIWDSNVYLSISRSPAGTGILTAAARCNTMTISFSLNFIHPDESANNETVSNETISQLIVTMAHMKKAVNSATKSVTSETLRDLDDFEKKIKSI